MTYPIDLQLFAEGGAGGAAGGDAGASGVNPQAAAAGNSGVIGQAAAAQHRSGGPAAQQGAQGTQQDDAAAWQEAKTRHKALYDADVQQILRGRLKDADATAKTMAALQPMLDALSEQYGVQAGDHQALVDKFFDDDRLYEQEAMDTGMTVDMVKTMHKLRAERDRAQAQVSQFTQQAQMEKHLQGLVQQGEALRQKYPAFDLQAAMQDERFVRMTSPNGGLTVEQAFAALHHDEMQAYAMQQAAQMSRAQAAQTVQANMARPRENAARGMAPPAQVRIDPSKLSLREIRSMLEQAQAGAKIGFD